MSVVWVLCVICTSVMWRQTEFSYSTYFGSCGCLQIKSAETRSCIRFMYFMFILIYSEYVQRSSGVWMRECVRVCHVPRLMCVMLYYDELGSTVKIMHIKFSHSKFPPCSMCKVCVSWIFDFNDIIRSRSTINQHINKKTKQKKTNREKERKTGEEERRRIVNRSAAKNYRLFLNQSVFLLYFN